MEALSLPQFYYNMTIDSSLIPSKERARLAVLCFFIAQGLCFSCFFIRLPDIKVHFGIDNIPLLGYLLTLLPIGKFLAIPAVGFLLPRIKSRMTTIISITGFIISLFVIGLVPNVYMLGVLLFLFGMFWNMTDISLNTQAIEVERMYGKPIIATFHAGWSISACIGALIGYLFVNIGINTFYHFSIMMVITLIIVFVNSRYLQKEATIATAKKDNQAQKKNIGLKKFKMPELLLIQLGLIWLVALIIENTIFDWSDIYFESVIKAPASLRIGFLICMVMISIGRFLANTAYRWWSKTTVLRIAGSLLFIGFITTGLFFDIADFTIRILVNSIAFMLIGLGISCVVPTIYSIVGEKSKTPTGIALTIMSSLSFVGPLIAPLLVGEVSKLWNMNWAYIIIGFLGFSIVLITLISKTLRK